MRLSHLQCNDTARRDYLWPCWIRAHTLRSSDRIVPSSPYCLLRCHSHPMRYCRSHFRDGVLLHTTTKERFFARYCACEKPHLYVLFWQGGFPELGTAVVALERIICLFLLMLPTLKCYSKMLPPDLKVATFLSSKIRHEPLLSSLSCHLTRTESSKESVLHLPRVLD